MTNGVRRTCFYASIAREVYVEVPITDRCDDDGDALGLLRLCLYETRDAAHRWQETVPTRLEELGSSRGSNTLCCICLSKP